jgi:hypothetical protein
MKRFAFILVPCAVIVMALTTAAVQQAEICDTKALKEAAKNKLTPYNYDSGKVTKLTYKNKPQLKEIEVPVFIGEKYRMVFNMSGITRGVVVTVFNKDKEAKNRKALWCSKDAKPEGGLYAFEPEGGKFKFYVDYEIPAVQDSAKAECAVFMLGYK